MEHLGSDSVVTADIVGQRLGAVLGQGHIVRHAAFGRSVTGDVDTDNPDVGIFFTSSMELETVSSSARLFLNPGNIL